jgi:NADH-quinone oxidoreductase subunit N
MAPGDFGTVLPEVTLAVVCMAFLLIGAFRQDDPRIHGALTFAMAGVLAGLGAVVAVAGGGRVEAFNGAFVDDAFGRFSKALVLFSSAAILALSKDYLERRRLLQFEYAVLIGLATLGMMIMVSAGDMMMLYLGLEIQSLSIYVIAAFRRDSPRSTEAGLKYFVLGALASGMLLYGMSLTYGFSGSTRFFAIAEVIREEGVSLGLLFGMVFVATGLAFKLSAAPFHMWTPDVYEGAPTPGTAFFSTAPKVAAAGLFTRILYEAFGDATGDWRQIIVFVALMSMFWGSIAAIGQTNLKRLMAYSSIGHMGYALVGLAAGTPQGASSVLIYLAIYVVMNTGVFAFILSMEREGRPVVQISDLAGLHKTRPGAALALAALMFSLTGIPPLAGFFAKYYVFVAAVEAGLAPLAVAGAVASVIGAFYYLRIVKIMYVDAEGEGLDDRLPSLNGLALTASALLVGIGWLPFIDGFGVTELSAAAAQSLFR